MFDSVDLTQIPGGAQAVAAYVDGRFANVTEARSMFPRARILTIAVFAGHDADALDIETGDATPGQAAAWYLRQKARGERRPVLYASAFVMDTEVIPALSAAGIGAGDVRLWSAHYTGTAHLCGPATCRELAVTADATQWTDKALGRNLDQSLLAPDFFAATAPTWTETLVNDLATLQQGATGEDVRTLQGALAARHHAIVIDGAFGAATRTALTAFQASKGLTADGIAGPLTWPKLLNR